MYSLHCTIFTKSLSYSLYAYVSTYSLNCSCWLRLKKGESLLVKHIDIFRLKNGRVQSTLQDCSSLKILHSWMFIWRVLSTQQLVIVQFHTLPFEKILLANIFACPVCASQIFSQPLGQRYQIKMACPTYMVLRVQHKRRVGCIFGARIRNKEIEYMTDTSF